MKKVLSISLWVILIGATFFLVGFSERKSESRNIIGYRINIDYSGGNYFIDNTDILQLLSDIGIDTTINITSVNIPEIEKIVNEVPSVRRADCYLTVRGQLCVDIEQRKPILRIFNPRGESYYLDEDGYVMPLSQKYTARVAVIYLQDTIGYGLIKDICFSDKRYRDSIWSETIKKLFHVYEIARYTVKDEFLRSLVSQYHIDDRGEIILIPKIATHTITFGDSTSVAEKFKTLKVFYREGLNKTGWEQYSNINLKYKNQVVCKKNNYGKQQ